MKKNFRILLWSISLSLFILNQNLVIANDKLNIEINNPKKIDLKVHNKSLTWILSKIASDGNINLVIPPEFEEKKVSINIENHSIQDSLNILSDIANFDIVNQDGYLVVMPRVIKEMKTQVFPLNNMRAVHFVYILQNIYKYNQDIDISFDDLTNSVIVKGTDTVLKEVSDIAKDYDVPKKSISMKINSNNKEDIIKSMKTKLFDNTELKKISDTSSVGGLDITFDENAGYMIKGKINRDDIASLPEEKPIIFLDQITDNIMVIGNPYQVSLAEEYLKYFQEATTVIASPQSNTEGIDSYKNELIKSKELLEETRKTLSKVIEVIQKKDAELNSALTEVANLKQELQAVKSKKMWKILSDKNRSIQEEQSAKENKEIFDLKEQINKRETKILAYSQEKEALEKQLAYKDTEISVLTDKLNEAKEEINKIITEKNINNNESEIAKETVSLLAMTRDQLTSTKRELGKVRQQLDDSKKQLNLIYGGSLLENITLPNDKSEWFK